MWQVLGRFITSDQGQTRGIAQHGRGALVLTHLMARHPGTEAICQLGVLLSMVKISHGA